MRIVFIFFIILLFTLDSTSQQNCHGCGVAFLKDRIYSPELNTYIVDTYDRDYKFLFYDSMIIAERHALYINTDANNVETVRNEVNGYTFVDFRTKSFYNYRNLSDTAGIILATRQPAKGRVKGGWNFFDPPRVPTVTIPFSDTAVEGKSYHRLKGFYLKNGDTVHTEYLYYVNEAERPVAFYGKTMANGERVSLIRLESLTLTKRNHFTSMDIASQNLTKKELKVFAAWKRNADRYPVPKEKEGLYMLGSNGSLVLDKEATEKFARQMEEATKKFTQQ